MFPLVQDIMLKAMSVFHELEKLFCVEPQVGDLTCNRVGPDVQRSKQASEMVYDTTVSL